jgi:hypothetical protein
MELIESLEGRVTRPRQVRYQAALRPDMYFPLDSKLPLRPRPQKFSTIHTFAS